MQNTIYIILTFSALLWGAVTDFKMRIIRNSVHVILLLAGFLAPLSAWEHIAGFFGMLLFYFITAKVLKKEAGGGDVKLFCSLGFNVGMVSMYIILAFTCVYALLFCKDKKQVPVCTYVFYGYCSLYAGAVILQRTNILQRLI